MNNKRIISLLLACIMLAFLIPAPSAIADTATVVTRPLGRAFFEYRGQSGSWRDLGTPIHYVEETGRIAYCLDHQKDSPTGDVYNEINPTTYHSENVQQGLKMILTYGFPSDRNGFSDDEARYATANAIRMWLAETTGAGYNFMDVSRGKIRAKSGYAGLLNWSKELLAYARSGKELDTATITLSKEEIEWTQQGKDYMAGPVTVKLSGTRFNTYKIDNPLASVTVDGFTGKTGDKLTFKTRDPKEVNFSFSGQAELVTTTMFYYAPGSSRLQPVVVPIGGQAPQAFAELTIEKLDITTTPPTTKPPGTPATTPPETTEPTTEIPTTEMPTKTPRPEFTGPPPEPELPDFNVAGHKQDAEGGHDGDNSTARGDASLAAGFRVDISSGQSFTMYANHQGHNALSPNFMLWTDINELNRTAETCDTGEEYTITYEGTGSITVTEIPPHGYLFETESGTGNGVRTFPVTYRAYIERALDEDEDGDFPAEEWPEEYEYEICGLNGDSSIMSWPILIGTAEFTNRVKKGQLQLVKGYNKNLDPFSGEQGEKEYMANSRWTMRLVNEGSENHPYVRVVPVSGDVYANNYRVVTDNSGVPADANNPLITSEFGQFRVSDIPFGKYILQEIKAGTEGYVLETVYIEIGAEGQRISRDVIDYPVKNEVIIVKVDSETGKTVPQANTAVRIRYMGNPNLSSADGEASASVVPGGGNDADPTQSPNYGRYLPNHSDINDSYRYVFYTGKNGKILLPYALPYTNPQLKS